MYYVTVRWLAQVGEPQAVYHGMDYEIEGDLLTIAIGEDHDVVVPLSRVAQVDIQREPAAR
jgi:hypothetical protein